MAKQSIHLISKTSFIKGLQCPKQLYLYKHHYNLQDPKSPETLAKFRRGTDIGKWAQQLFPGGVNLEPKSKFAYAEAIKNTQKSIEQKMPILYEATFEFNQTLIIIDILVYNNGKWDAYEVKSSHQVSDVYLNDISLQAFIMKQSGITLNNINLVLLNDNVTIDNLSTPDNDFKIIPVKDKVAENELFIARELEKMKETIAMTSIPAIEMGEQCHTPYTCDFISFCKKQSINL